MTRSHFDLPEPVLRRLFVTEDGCWEWLGARANGYGVVQVRKRTWRVHRFVYEALVGPVPRELDLDHLCRNRACANPAHLEPVTRAENLRRGTRLITHCPQGHPYAGENLGVDSRGHRFCRECKRAGDRERYRRKVAA